MAKHIAFVILLAISIAGCTGQKSIEVGSPDINESNIPTMSFSSLLSEKVEIRFNEEWELAEHEVAGENVERALFRPVGDGSLARSVEVVLERGKTISFPDRVEKLGEFVSVIMSANIDDLLITYDATIFPSEADVLPVQVLDKETEEGIKGLDIDYSEVVFSDKENPEYKKPLIPQSNSVDEQKMVIINRGPTLNPVLKPTISGAGGTSNVHANPDPSAQGIHIVGDDDEDEDGDD